eukprot:757634-Hanusia_phi.AAC.1
MAVFVALAQLGDEGEGSGNGGRARTRGLQDVLNEVEGRTKLLLLRRRRKRGRRGGEDKVLEEVEGEEEMAEK